MWHWYWDDTRRALTSQWFGIPYGCYSLFSRLFERALVRRRPGSIAGHSLVAVLALVCSLATLFGTENYLYPFLRDLGITSGIRLSLIVAVLVILAVRGWRTRGRIKAALPRITLWAPGWFHLFFGFCFFALGFYRENGWMTLAAVANILTGVTIHLAPYRAGTSVSKPPREPALQARAAGG